VGAAVYLAGPINGQTDAQCKVWREQAAARLEAAGLTALSPLARDYRGVEAQHVTEIVEGDLADLATCDAVLVDAWRPSWGTAMEIREAHRLGKRVFAFVGRTRPLSPWLSYHATCFPDMHDAITALVGWAETRGGTA
jgi:nucleoside 2-deoxyribosyltransferase